MLDRQERFANVETGEFLPLANDYTPPSPSQERRGSAPCRSAADDGHVVDCVWHAAIKLASLRRKQTTEGALLKPSCRDVTALLVGNGRRRSVDLRQTDCKLFSIGQRPGPGGS